MKHLSRLLTVFLLTAVVFCMLSEAAWAESAEDDTNVDVQVIQAKAIPAEGKMAVTLSIHTEQPLFIVLENALATDEPLYVTQADVEDMWSMRPLTGEAWKDEQYALELALPDGYQTNRTARLFLTFLAVQKQVCPIDTHADPAAMWEAIDECVQRGDTPIEAEEPWHVLLGSQFFATIGETTQSKDCAQYPIGDSDAFAKYANMRVLETVEAPFVASLSVETSAQAADFANAFFNSPHVKEGSAETNAALGAMEVSETEDG